MINSSMQKLGANRSTIRELFEYGKMLSAKIGAENVFDFSLGNPSVEPPKEVKEGILELIEKEDETSLHGYTSAIGDTAAREAIAKHIKDRFGTDAKASDIYLTAGAAGALTSTLGALSVAGESIIALSPYFPEYKVFAERNGANLIEVPCRPSDFCPDIDALDKAIDGNVAAIIVNSPNNPTGAVYSSEDISALSELLRRKSKEYGKTIYLIADEPYRELVYDGARVPFIPNYYDNTVVCYSYSKSLSIPGERIGYVFVSPTMENKKEVYEAIIGTGRALGFVCAPSLLQKLIPYCIGKTSDIDVYNSNRTILLSALREYGYETVPPLGAFYLFVKAPGGDSKEFSEKAKEFGLLLVPSDDFGIGGYVRIAYCQNPDMIKRSLPKFKELIDSYR